MKNPFAPTDHVATNIDNSRSSWLIPQAILAVLTVLALCAVGFALQHEGTLSPGGSNDAVPAVSQLSPTSFVGDGPYGVGVTTQWISASSGSAPVEIWYPTSADNAHGTQAHTSLANYLPSAWVAAVPALRHVSIPLYGFLNVPVAQGRFPIAVFSHGFGGFNAQSSELLSHLASWGYVVAAPEHTSRDASAVLNQIVLKHRLPAVTNQDVRDLADTVTALTNDTANSDSAFYNHLDVTRIVAIGHSQGGIAAQQFAATQPNVRGFIGLAGAVDPANPNGASPSVPKSASLIMSGSLDKIVPTPTLVRAYNSFHSPKRFIELNNAGHLIFTNTCPIATNAILSGLVAKYHLSIPASLLALSQDGCQASAMSARQGWPIINQAVVAEARWSMGFDRSQAGLDDLENHWPSLIIQNTTEPNA